MCNTCTSARFIILIYKFTTLNISLIGNYDLSLSDAKAAHDLQPTFLRAIERGKSLTEDVLAAFFLLKTFFLFKNPAHQLNQSGDYQHNNAFRKQF